MLVVEMDSVIVLLYCKWDKLERIGKIVSGVREHIMSAHRAAMA